jgi:lysyl-tRNA synthetase class 2
VPRRTAAAVTAIVGGADIALALLPAREPDRALVLAAASAGELAVPSRIALPLGALLLVAAVQLVRGRRGAVELAVAVLVGLGAADLARGSDVADAALPGMVAAGLWCTRAAFPVLAPWRLGRRGCAAGLLGIAALAAADRVGAAPSALLLAAGGAFLLAIAAAGALVPRLPAPAGGDRERTAALVRAHGADSLSAFKLRRDLQRRFHLGGQAVVGQRAWHGVLLVAGDPVCPPQQLREALCEIRADARSHGLAPALRGASDGCAAAARAVGLRSLYVGDEAFLPTGPMPLTGRAHRSLRKAVNRVARSYTAELHEAGELDERTLAELRAVGASRRAGAPERGFAMASEDIADALLPDALVVLARAAGGEIGGFLHFVPVFGRPQVSLGSMRRDRSTPNGLTDFLVVRSAELLAARGIEELSLNFAVLGRWLRAPTTAGQRCVARVLRIADRWFQIERLGRYNAKFAPRWQPRHLVYEHATSLPRVILAVMAAEGQLPTPPRGPARLPGAWRRAVA